jgi:uncharacterized protein
MSWDTWLIFLFLAVIVPWRGRVRMQKLLAMEHVRTRERVALYAATIGFQWAIAAIVAWRAWAQGFSLHQLGLIAGSRWRTAAAAIVGAILVGAFQWANLRRLGRLPLEARGALQPIAERLLPQNRLEGLPFFALCATAGVCEEFLYRGFSIAVLWRAGLANWEVVGLTAILFGLAHLYQGRSGLVGTLLIGAVFGVARIAYDSLIPVTIWHSTLDVVAGLAGGRYLSRRNADPSSVSQVSTQE